MSDADSQETERYFEVLGLSNDWYLKQLNQGNNLDSFIEELFIKDLITKEQENYLQEKDKAMDNFVGKSLDELEKDLNDLSVKTLEQTKKTIEKNIKQM
ncbi:hypothetical protein [Neobacillus mesonae]|uniref:hypothetical protein n=1 Tax=Neobacillus mesonae TaxID=1193713 RepID=UPI00203FABC0|nr:hypothetical protein [Neobacillus mesonae]MCM3569949.1 hypothetical protein [Neobacillus mesonae]